MDNLELEKRGKMITENDNKCLKMTIKIMIIIFTIIITVIMIILAIIVMMILKKYI